MLGQSFAPALKVPRGGLKEHGYDKTENQRSDVSTAYAFAYCCLYRGYCVISFMLFSCPKFLSVGPFKTQSREGICRNSKLLKSAQRPKVSEFFAGYNKICFCRCGFEFVLGLLLATALYSLEEKKGNLFKTLYIRPIAVPLIVAGLAWRWMYHPQAGIVPLIFDIFTSNTPLFLSDPNLSLTAVILVDIWKNTPFMVLILLAGL